MTTVIEDAKALFERCEAARHEGKRVGFVPTMGALHDGHMSLIDQARGQGARFIVTSIFVNPLQFGPTEDYGRYPRTFEADLERCRARGVDLVYAPRADSMYPGGFATHVEVAGVTASFEGTHRPGHFRGVTTVVVKLLHAVGSCVAVFGRKDYQQWRTLERMVTDLNMPVQMVGAPIVREHDGLALSSRNRYLDPQERERALGIVTGLRSAWDAYQQGTRQPEVLAAIARAPIAERLDRIDYVSCADPETLAPASEPREALALLVAAYLGKTRLIDNLELGSDPRP